MRTKHEVVYIFALLFLKSMFHNLKMTSQMVGRGLEKAQIVSMSPSHPHKLLATPLVLFPVSLSPGSPFPKADSTLFIPTDIVTSLRPPVVIFTPCSIPMAEKALYSITQEVETYKLYFQASPGKKLADLISKPTRSGSILLLFQLLGRQR